MDFGNYTSLIGSMDPRALWFFVGAMGTYYVSTVIYALRWKIVLSEMGREIPLLELLKVTLSSIFINNITPMSRGGGEVLRVAWISKVHDVPVTLSMGSIIYERISEVVPLMLLLAIGLSHFSGHLVASTLLITALVVGLWLKWESTVRFSLRIFKTHISEEDVDRLVALKKNVPFNLTVVGLSSLVWALDITRLKLITMAFKWNPPLELLAVISLANLLFGLLAFTPGGIGIVEGGLVGSMKYFGIDGPLAVSVALLERFISYVSSTIVGFVTLVTSGGMKVWRASKSH
ncbi:lysylphosphatidylglycerol synthase transmembrane domain-containing protein [Thermococcus sp. 21S7]|uniref:lysylphosphatidylglycerol synthase transmembrane domain-containing protein n=1 Tax=Thermococcus sp. 21S7 TaxID=1638221 RepID=UPI00143A1F84|nr:lysylphosphatidylglycerol synthase transmembrane domain-containing protein [Thermococcus sp. 21S7]NJE61209.1 flippase-like domain-containing protein [Thermococcus sp. 21S7]